MPFVFLKGCLLNIIASDCNANAACVTADAQREQFAQVLWHLIINIIFRRKSLCLHSMVLGHIPCTALFWKQLCFYCLPFLLRVVRLLSESTFFIAEDELTLSVLLKFKESYVLFFRVPQYSNYTSLTSFQITFVRHFGRK